jgi:hypothetical protein
MQVPSLPNAATQFERIVASEVLGRRGLRAWDALLRAHATLLRQLEIDLENKTGLGLADFDVLAQLAIGGGSLRMTELADRALISRSGMTRRVARLVQEGLVGRAHADTDGRGVVVQLTDAVVPIGGSGTGRQSAFPRLPAAWVRQTVEGRLRASAASSTVSGVAAGIWTWLRPGASRPSDK